MLKPGGKLAFVLIFQINGAPMIDKRKSARFSRYHRALGYISQAIRGSAPHRPRRAFRRSAGRRGTSKFLDL
jgi:hypothetical protein